VPAFIVVVGLPNLALSTLATVYYSTTWTLTYRELVVLDADSGAEVEPRVGDEADLEVGPEEG
jgi:hypothetical protein